MTYKAVTELLPGLSRTELQQIKDRCSLLIGGVSGIVTTTRKKKIELVRADKDDWYAHAVGRYAAKRGWCPKGMVAVHLSQQGLALLPEYLERSKAMRVHVQKMVASVSPDQLENIGDICVKAMILMIEDLNSRATHPVHVDSYTLLSWVTQVPMALDRQFPGYMRGGMLGLLLRGGARV